MLRTVFFILFLFLLSSCKKNEDYIIRSEPEQINYEKPYQLPFHEEEYKVFAIAKFDISARVLSTESYYMDQGAKFSPLDVALGWKDMSNPEFISDISISQSSRFYFWRTNENKYQQRDKISLNSANMHLIPANKQVKSMFKYLKEGKTVHIKGHLVNVSYKNWFWHTSLRRDDTGAGACEIIYVEDIFPIEP